MYEEALKEIEERTDDTQGRDDVMLAVKLQIKACHESSGWPKKLTMGGKDSTHLNVKKTSISSPPSVVKITHGSRIVIRSFLLIVSLLVNVDEHDSYCS